jgi:hypothetical protein
MMLDFAIWNVASGGEIPMKVFLMIIGSLCGLYAAFGVVQFIRTLMNSNPGTAFGVANIAANLIPICVGLVVCIVCFQRAFDD